MLAGHLFGATAALAEDEPITWSVRPATEAGADGRSWIELELEPGESAVEYAEVSNFSDQEVTFTLTSADGYLTPTGRFNMLPRDQESTDAGSWIDADDSLKLSANSSTVIPLQIAVPTDATPGDHAAGFAASVFSKGSDDEGTEVGVESRVGFRVMVRVGGELEPSLGPFEVAAHYDMSWNPFSPGRVVADVTVANVGNTRLDLELEAAAAWQEANAEDQSGELFPGTERELSVIVHDVWPLGIVLLDVTVTGVPLDAQGGTDSAPISQTTQVAVWAIPWPQLAVVAGATLIVFAILVGRRRERRRFQHQIEEAREEAVREAMAMEGSK